MVYQAVILGLAWELPLLLNAVKWASFVSTKFTWEGKRSTEEDSPWESHQEGRDQQVLRDPRQPD